MPHNLSAVKPHTNQKYEILVAIPAVEGHFSRFDACVWAEIGTSGFKVVDLGNKVPSATFAKKAKEVNADIIAVSCSTTPGKNNLPKFMEAVEAEGLKGKVAIMTGGIGVDKDAADKAGIMYGSTREEAVALAKKAMEAK